MEKETFFRRIARMASLSEVEVEMESDDHLLPLPECFSTAAVVDEEQ